jgi:two-component system cell cycle response regulator DivK
MLRLKDRLIFVVEDNTQNRVIFQMTLVRHGAHLEFERWGQATLTQLKRLPKVDAIILDLMLAHHINGFDIYDQIRACREFAQVPIVAVSAMDPAVAIPLARDKGFAGFIAKPIDTKRFPEQIASVIEGEQVWYIGEYTS